MIFKFNTPYFEADGGQGGAGNPEGDNKKPEGANDPSPKGDEGKKFSQEELEAILTDRLSRKERKLKEQFGDYDDIKQKLKEYEEQKQKKEREELSELERLQKDLEEKDGKLSEYEKRMQKIEEERKQERITRAFEAEARKANIEYVDDAYKLANIEAIEINEDGSVKNMADIVKELVEAKPFLVKKEAKQKPIGEPSGGSEQKRSKSDQQILAELAAKAKQSGSMKDRMAYVEFKRKIQGQ